MVPSAWRRFCRPRRAQARQDRDRRGPRRAQALQDAL